MAKKKKKRKKQRSKVAKKAKSEKSRAENSEVEMKETANSSQEVQQELQQEPQQLFPDDFPLGSKLDGIDPNSPEYNALKRFFDYQALRVIEHQRRLRKKLLD